MTRPDPTVRRDGRCARCLGLRKVPPKHHSTIDSAVYERDPFCSSMCARIWHGLEPAKPREFAARNQICAGCKCDLDSRTEGCDNCADRHGMRARRVAA